MKGGTKNMELANMTKKSHVTFNTQSILIDELIIYTQKSFCPYQ